MGDKKVRSIQLPAEGQLRVLLRGSVLTKNRIPNIENAITIFAKELSDKTFDTAGILASEIDQLALQAQGKLNWSAADYFLYCRLLEEVLTTTNS